MGRVGEHSGISLGSACCQRNASRVPKQMVDDPAHEYQRCDRAFSSTFLRQFLVNHFREAGKVRATSTAAPPLIRGWIANGCLDLI
jgi:hypothetical protein